MLDCFYKEDAALNAKEKLKVLRKNEKSLFVVHYSCQNLNDNNENYSPRITSIAVLHVDSSTMHSFSIHLIAEEQNISRDKIDDQYDALEGKMLSNFFDFVKDNPEVFWLHWNMTNINYGFEALAHRYKVLTKKDAPRIADSRRYNLSTIILGTYGKNCVDHPRMQKFMELNDGVHRNVLNGKDEVDAFADKEYIKLHKSTMGKAYWFGSMYRRIQYGKVITKRSNFKHKVNDFMETPWVKILAFIAILFSLYQLSSSVLF